MSGEVWKYITEQASIIKSTRLEEMKKLAKQCEKEELEKISGFKLFIKPEYLLNGDLVVKIEASRKIMLGYLTQSITGGFEVSADGEISFYEKPIKVTERTSVRERWESMVNS